MSENKGNAIFIVLCIIGVLFLMLFAINFLILEKDPFYWTNPLNYSNASAGYGNLSISVSDSEINATVNSGTTEVNQVILGGTILHNETPDLYICGEQNGVIAGGNDGFEYSVGNGMEGHYNNWYSRRNAKVIDVDFMCKTSTTTATKVNVTINGNPVACQITSSGVSQSKGSTASYSYSTCQGNVELNFGDGLGFQTQAYDSATSYCTICAGVKYLE